PGELAALRDDADRLCAGLTEVAAEQRRALVMAGLLGHTAREVSEAEDIPLGTAKTRIRTALLRLRSALTEERAEGGRGDERILVRRGSRARAGAGPGQRLRSRARRSAPARRRGG